MKLVTLSARDAGARATILSLQQLRFLAAALVVLSHTEDRMLQFGERFHVSVEIIGFSGRFGVDIFFVISGFIMGVIALDRFGSVSAAVHFAKNRIARIVPIYWIMTTAAIGIIFLANTLGDPNRNDPVTAEYLIKSLLFIPYLNFAGEHRPVLPVGWTLDFEMFFYAVFALCLLFRRTTGSLLLAATFGAVFLIGRNEWAPAPLGIWANPIIFEFLLGFGLALVRRQMGWRIAARGHFIILVAVIAAYTAIPAPSLLLNAMIAVLLVAFCALSTDIASPSRFDRMIVRFGDASYSMYLTHGFVLLFVGIAWRKLFGGEMLELYAAAIFIGAIAVALLSFQFVERPSSSLARRLLGLRSAREARLRADEMPNAALPPERA